MTSNLILPPIPFEDFKNLLFEIVDSVVSKRLNAFYSEKEIDLLTRKETKQLLGICYQTLHVYTKTGKLQAYKVGRNVRYKKTEIEQALLQP